MYFLFLVSFFVRGDLECFFYSFSWLHLRFSSSPMTLFHGSYHTYFILFYSGVPFNFVLCRIWIVCNLVDGSYVLVRERSILSSLYILGLYFMGLYLHFFFASYLLTY